MKKKPLFIEKKSQLSIILFIWWFFLIIQMVVNLGQFLSVLFVFFTLITSLYRPILAPVYMYVSLYTPVSSLDIPRPYFLVFFVCSIALLLRVRFKLSLVDNKLNYFILCFLWLAFFSVSYTISSNPFSILISFVQFVLILFFVQQGIRSNGELTFLINSVLVFSAVSLFFGLLQWQIGPDTWLYKKIILQSPAGDMFFKKLYISSDMQTVRMIWAGIEPNFYANTLIFPAILVQAKLLENNKIVWVFVFLLLILAILGTFSRSAFVITFFGVFTFHFLTKNFKLMAAAIVPLLIIIFVLYPDFLMRILSIESNLIEDGGTGRFYLTMLGLEYWSHNILGTGIGSVSVALKGLGSSYVDTGTSHNTYVQILAELGLQGLLFFVAIIITACSFYFRVFRRVNEKNRINKLALAGLIGLIFQSLHLATIPTYDFMNFSFALVLGVLMNRIYLQSNSFNGFKC